MLVAFCIGEGHTSLGALSGQGHNVGFLLVEFGVEHLVGDMAHLEHTAEEFAHVHTGRTDEDGAAREAHLLHLGNDSGILLALRLIDAVVHVDTLNGAVGGDFHHVEFVDIPELASLRDGGTSHTGQLVVHTEVVLEGDGGEGLCGGFHLHVLLGFDGLVQTVAPAAAFHDTARLLIDNLDLSVHHHVFFVDAEHRVSLEQCENRMYALALDGIVREEFVLAHHAFFVRQARVGFKGREFGGHVGEHEELVVVYLVGQPFVTLVRQVNGVEFLVHDEVERVGGFGHTAVVVLHIDGLGLEHTRLDTRFAEELDERIVLGQGLVAAEEREETFLLLLLVARGDERLGFGQILRGQFALHIHETFHQRLVFLEQLHVALGHRARNDERRTGVVNQDGVHLIDDGIVVAALHEVFGHHSHIVTQVVKTELIVRTKGDVGHVCLATGLGVGLVLVNAVNAQTMEHINRSVPFGVALGQVIVDRDHVHAVSGEGVEENGKGRDERLTFTRCHLGDFSLMQYSTANQLYVIVNHVPLHVIAAGYPVVLVDGLVAFDAHEVACGGQFAVEIIGSDNEFFVLGEAACSILDNGEGDGLHLVEGFFHAVEYFLLQFVNLVEDDLTLFDGCLFDFGLQVRNLFFQVVGRVLHLGLNLLGLGAEFVVAERSKCRVNLFDLVHVGLNGLHVARGFVAKDFTQKIIDIHIVYCCFR